MSWWIYLEDEQGRTVSVAPDSAGGTYAIGGIAQASLNVTYNYGEAFRVVDFDFNNLNGMTGADATPELERAVAKLGTTQYTRDYWAPTPGNAGHALNILLTWARQHPTTVFRVS
jgi:hypothetical protein